MLNIPTGAKLPDLDSIRTLFERFHRKQVLVVGDLMADQFVYGETVRLSREAPVPVLHVDRVDYELGGAANVARYLKLFGAEVTLCGIVGYDDGAEHIHRQMARRGIGTGGLFRSSLRPTILKVRVIAEPYGQQLLRIDYENTEPIDAADITSLSACIRAYLPMVDAVLVADYDKGMFKVRDLSDFLINEADKRKVPLIVDTKTHHYRMFPKTALTIGHYADALQYYQKNHEGREPGIRELGQDLIEHLGPQALLLNCEDKGLALFRKDQEPVLFGKSRVGMLDFIGAGDALASMMALAIGSGVEYETATALGWLALSTVLTTSGAEDVTLETILRYANTLVVA